MWWKTDHQVTKWLRRLQDAIAVLETENQNLAKDLADAKRDVRTLDLDMAGLEDKFKALSGRISVSKRRDRQPEAELEPEIDLNQAIRDGVITKWPT